MSTPPVEAKASSFKLYHYYLNTLRLWALLDDALGYALFSDQAAWSHR